MKADVVIVGGGPAGVITALTTRSVYPDRSVVLVKSVGDGVIPCAVPYMIETMPDPEQNRMGDRPLDEAGVKVVVDEVSSLDPAAKTVALAGGDRIAYRRLVLATGSEPIVPPIPGIDKEGVFAIEKSLGAMDRVRRAVRRAKSVVIIGGGFIGAEFADEISGLPGLEVTLVEVQPRLLASALDPEFGDEVTGLLEGAGCRILTGERIVSINGGEGVESVSLEGGTTVDADVVIIGVGSRPASRLAKEAGLLTVERGAIWVDSYLRTDGDSVFAVGDCAVKRDFFTRRAVPVMLASNATAEARIAGTNLFGIRAMRQIQGTIAAFSTRIGDTAFASTGMTGETCEREGFSTVSSTVASVDRHPGTLPGGVPLKVKLVFTVGSGTLLGGQASGGPSVGELINVIALGIQKGVTVRELDMLQIATHPLLTSAPTVHPLINAAHSALAELRAASA